MAAVSITNDEGIASAVFPLSASAQPPLASCKSAETPSSKRYQDAVRTLNSLQSNVASIQKLKDKNGDAQAQHVSQRMVTETVSCLARIGITVADLDVLRVVHVTGTKGKGSTCAYIEAMLRSLGLKTGFFSSPHLVHVRERIRINGQPMSEEEFADTFFAVHERLEKVPSSDPEDPAMPAYFKFLIVVAFVVFLGEKVDVAIVEVGIGGEYDSTNVFRSPVACGITTLDIDHVALLGNSLEEIAWHKAGIFKRNTTAVFASDQTPKAADVIGKRAAERKVASLSAAPSLSAYSFIENGAPHFGIDGAHQKTNLALALQLARAWLHTERPQLEQQLWTTETIAWCPGSAFVVPTVWAEAISRCHWLGRSQILIRGARRFFLDGAHTVKSMESCVEWFRAASRLSGLVEGNGVENEKRSIALIFHCTGDRMPETLMERLKALPFSRVLLCPPMLRLPTSPHDDNFIGSPDEHIKQSIKCKSAWQMLRPDMDTSRVLRFDCVSDALEELRRSGQEEEDILVTGSLILVGNILSALGYKEEHDD